MIAINDKQTDIYMNEIVEYWDPFLCIRMLERQYHPCAALHFGDWHYHREIEFLAVLEGQMGMETTDGTIMLRAGEVCVIGASEAHRSLKGGPEPLRYWVLQFDPIPYFDPSTMAYLSVFSENHFPLSRLNDIFKQQPVAQEAYRCIQQLNEIMSLKPKGYGMAISSLVKQILWIVIREDTYDLLPPVDHPGHARLQPVLDYIEQHLADKIKVEDGCRMLSFSYHHFIKLFKQTMGLSFTDYLHLRRIKQAEKLLLTGNASLLEIGEAIGIPNSAQFHKLFKRYHNCSPKQYRDQRKRNTP